MRWRSSFSLLAQFRPSSSTVPASGAVSPSQISMVVVFPAPFGPSNPKHSPRVTSRSRPSTATTSANALRRPRSRSDGPFAWVGDPFAGTAIAPELVWESKFLIRRDSSGRFGPIFDFESLDRSEFASVVGHQCEPKTTCMRRDKQIMRTDHNPTQPEVRTNLRIMDSRFVGIV
jgi:hypothetical protein